MILTEADVRRIVRDEIKRHEESRRLQRNDAEYIRTKSIEGEAQREENYRSDIQVRTKQQDRHT